MTNWIMKLEADYPESFHQITNSHLDKGTARSEDIIGINKRHKPSTQKGFNIYWIARATGEHRILTKAYNIEKYGEKLAFKLACITRYEWCGTLRVINLKKLPCKPPVPYVIIK